jgi:hypothetical protein
VVKKAKGKRQKAKGKGEKAEGRRQKAEGREMRVASDRLQGNTIINSGILIPQGFLKPGTLNLKPATDT